MYIVINKTMVELGNDINEYCIFCKEKEQAEFEVNFRQKTDKKLGLNDEYEIVEVDVFGLLNQTEMIKRYLNKWQEQLGFDGCNSKGMVRNDIQHLLKQLN